MKEAIPFLGVPEVVLTDKHLDLSVSVIKLGNINMNMHNNTSSRV